MGETKTLTCLLETEHGICFVTVDAQATVQAIARQYSIPIPGAWDMLRKYTYSKAQLAMVYPAKCKIGDMELDEPMSFPPQEYLVVNPTLVEKCRAFVKSGAETMPPAKES